jgi:hypothetical protein
MWDLLKKSDIEQAKLELKLRRAEILRRHAEESQSLAEDRAEVETLNNLIDTFIQKFSKPPKISHAPAPAAIATHKISDNSSPEAKHQHHRDQHRHQPRHKHETVFASFMRATSRV